MNNTKRAFTLSEILITLGIIGVIAALTIPGLITKYKKIRTATTLKKAISVINQAYRSSFDDVGEPGNSFVMGSEEYFKTYWAPYIKALTYCDTYKHCGYDSSAPFKYLDNTNAALLVVAKKQEQLFTQQTAFYI